MKYITLIIGLLVVGCGKKESKSSSPEERIEAAIRSHLEKPKGELTKSDYERVKIFSLHVRHTPLGREEPDDGAFGMNSFFGNFVSDLSSLTKLTNLESLNLSNNPITDLTPLAELSKLKWLSLDGTPVADLSPLYGLTELEILNLGDNPNLSSSEIEKLKGALPNCEVP